MRQVILRVISPVLIVVGSALLAVGGISVAWVRFSLGGLLVIVGFVLLYDRNRAVISASRASDALDPPTRFRHREEISDAVARITDSSKGSRYIAGGEVTPFALASFTTLLSSPRLFHGRIVEEIQPSGRQITQKVSSSLLLDMARLTRGVDLSVSTDAPGNTFDDLASEDRAVRFADGDGKTSETGDGKLTVFYPAVVIRKGEMQNYFHVDVKGEDAVVTLTFEEYCQLITIAIRSVQRLILTKLSSVHHVELCDLVDRALALIRGRGVQSDDYSKYDKASLDLASDISQFIADVDLDVRLQNHIAAIGGFARDYASRYPVAIVLPPSVVEATRAVVRYERQYTPRWCYGQANENRWRFFTERFAAILGARPGELEIEIGRASEAQSYHILINGSPDAYVGEQRIYGIDRYCMLGHQDIHYRFRRPLGQPYVHGYFRDVVLKESSRPTGSRGGNDGGMRLPSSRHVADGLMLRVRFFETPPGSIAKSAISAAAALFLIWAVAAVSSAAGVTPDNVDFAAVILAFPAIAAASVGFEKSTGDSTVGTEIVAKVTALLTFGVTLLAAALYMAQTRNLLREEVVGFSVAGIQNVWWLLSFVTAFLILLWTLIVWAERSIRYFSVLGLGNRSDGSTAGAPQDVEYGLRKYAHRRGKEDIRRARVTA